MLIHNRYRVVQESGQENVLLVVDTWREEKRLALKLIRAEQPGTQTTVQLRYEFAALCQLKHPNLASVYDLGFLPETQQYFYTTDVVEGETLRVYAARRRAASPDDWSWLYPIAAQLCRVLQYIHQRGLIHHNVQPDNIRVTAQGQVKLMDFGLTGTEREATSFRLRGAPEYAAPELIRGEAVDARADLYALGVTLYESVTGSLPFASDSYLTLFRHHLETPPPARFAESVPPELQKLILKLLAKEPLQRYPNADAVLQALATLSKLDDKPHQSQRRGYVYCTACVGRETELEMLQAMLASTTQGKPQGVLITGPAGVGKSRVLREVRLRAQLQGFWVVEVPPAFPVASPFSMWQHILREILAYRRLSTAAGVQRYGPLLALLLSTTEAGDLEPLPPVSENLRTELIQLIANVLTSLHWPLLILLDDLQKADPQSLDILPEVLAQLSQAHVCIVAAAQTDELSASHPLYAWLHAGKPFPFHHIPLTPLNREQVHEYVRTAFGASADEGDWVDRLHAASGGVPRQIEGILYRLVGHKALQHDAVSGWRLVPESAAPVLAQGPANAAQRLESLDATTREVLRWAALLGMEPDVRLLAQASGIYPDKFLVLLDHAMQAQLLWYRERGGFPVYRFDTEEIRDYLIAAMPLEQRRTAYRRIAEKMEHLYKKGAAPEGLAWYYALGGDIERAVELYRVAAQQAEAINAHHTALHYLGIALELVEKTTPEVEWDLRMKRAALWASLNDYEAQAQELTALAEVVRLLDDPRREVEWQLRRAEAEEKREQRMAALHLARTARDLAHRHGFVELEAKATTTEGRLLCMLDHYAEAQVVLERALNLYTDVDARRDEIEALRWLGEALRRQGNITDALGAYNRVLELARWMGDLGAESDALNALGVLTHDLARRRSLYEASLHLARVLHDQRRQSRAYNNLGLVYWRLGLYARARTYLEEAVAMQRAQRLRSGLVYSLESLARVCMAQGDHETARALLEEGLDLSRHLETKVNEALYWMAWGVLQRDQGELEAARTSLERACQMFREANALNYVCVAASKLALVLLDLGEREAARAMTDTALKALISDGITASFPVQEVWWERYQVLRALEGADQSLSAEAQEALENACELLLESAASLSDAGLRRIYVFKVPLHQDILEAWRAWRGHAPRELRAADVVTEMPDERLRRLHDLTTTMYEIEDAGALLDFMLDHVLELSGATRAVVYLTRSPGAFELEAVREYDPLTLPPPMSLVNTVAYTKAPVLIADVKRDERYAREASLLKAGIRSVLAVPLMVEDTVYGVMYADLQEAVLGFTVQDVELMRLFAQHAARALHNVQVLGDVRARMQDLEALRQVSLTLASQPGLTEMLNTLLDGVARLFPDMEHAHVFLYEQGRLDFAASLWADGTRGRLAALPRRYGLTYTVAQQGQVIAISSLHHHPLFMDRNIMEEGAMVGVPLKVSERVVGVLNVAFAQPREFTARDLHLLGLLADQTAVAIESARLLQQLQQTVQRLAALNAVSRDITSMLDLPRMLERIAGHARNLMEADECEIYLLDADRKILRPIVALGPYAERIKQRPIRVGEGIIGHVAQTGVSEVVDDTSTDPRAIRIAGTPDAHALMGVALHARNELVGVMALTRDPSRGPFTEDALDFMSNLARQAAIAIENARLYWTERTRREEVAQALEEMQRLEQMKDQFIQNVSHELRTPLTLVHGYAELMRSGALGPITSQQDEALEVIQRRTAFLIETVTDFTMLIEIQARGLRAELMDVPPLLHEVIANTRPAAEAAHLSFETEIQPKLPKIRSETVYLRRVLDNLLSNAIKFTPPGGRVSLRAWREGKYICVAVSDTGIGIPASERERIFQRFYQIDGSTTRSHGGTGLGLAVVKEIVEAHGGQIHLESTEGRGSTFTIRLPIAGA